MADQSIVPYEEPRSETPDVWRPVLTVAQVVQRQNAIAAVMHDAMKKDTHYGVVPGTKSKPSLYKAGAEMLTTFFGLSKSFTILDRIEDWTGKNNDGTPFFYYLVRCHLRRGDALIAEADGSCNSNEARYRWRWSDATEPSKEDQATLKKTGLGKWQQFGSKWVWQERTLNPDLAAVVNTVLKMAEKRALVATTLLAVGASDFFTQDVEDMAADYVDAEIVTTPTQPEPLASSPANAPQAAAPKTNGQAQYSSVRRPWEPDLLIAKLQTAAEKPFAGTHSDGMKGSTVGWLDEICGGADRRHTLLKVLFGKPSSKQLSESEWEALDIWRRVGEDGLFRKTNGQDIAVETCRDEANRAINREIQAQAVGTLFDTESAGK